MREVSKEECVTMADFNHGHIQWKSFESAAINVRTGNTYKNIGGGTSTKTNINI